jgi:hypothetical protein
MNHAPLRRKKHLDHSLIMTHTAVYHALNDILHTVHEVSERFDTDAHRGTLQIVRDTEKLLKELASLSRTQGDGRGLKGMKRFGRVVDEALNQFAIYF